MNPVTTPLFGWCGPMDRAADMRAAGVDYIEAQIVPMQLENDASFAEAKARVRDFLEGRAAKVRKQD